MNQPLLFDEAFEDTPMKPLLDIINEGMPTPRPRRPFRRFLRAVCISVIALPLAICGISLEFDDDDRDAGERWLDAVCRQQTSGTRDG